MFKRIIFAINILMIALITWGGFWYVTRGAIWRKGTASTLFFLLGLINLIYALIVRSGKIRYIVTMTLGLLVCVAADIYLQIEFLCGAVLFAVGHILYFAGYCFLRPIRKGDWIVCAAIGIPAVIFLLTPLFDYEGIMEIMCLAYGVILSCMVGKGVSNLIAERNVRNTVIVIGCLLFFFSDLMLVLNMFAHLPKIIDTLCVVSYYPAQAMLGFSLYFAASREKTV